MQYIHVKLKENGYRIAIGSGILPKLGEALIKLKIGKDAVIVTNSIIQKYHGARLVAGLKKHGISVKFLVVPDGEKSKSAKAAFELMGKIAAYDVKKKIFVIALGGGVVGDLAGYVAAAYKRGVPYIQVPTTLLAQIDSAIGGKVAIDLPMGKNLVGAFYQPKLIWTDVSVLSTLSSRQIRNGLAEAVKYGIISDPKLFSFIEKNRRKLLARDAQALTKLVVACSRIKARVVSLDEKETKGLRTILNFGHTAGHAIEAAGGYGLYQHGEAISIGMCVAAEISWALGLLSKENVLRIERLLSAIGLPVKFKKINLSKILKVMEHDKKFKAGKNRFVLATAIGKVKVTEGVPPDVIKQALQNCLANS